MKKYSIIQAFFMSFYSPSLYRDVARNWGGIGFFYLLLALAISWIPSMYLLNINIKDFFQNKAQVWLEQIPTVTINNGKVSIDRPVPYFIKIPKDGQVIAIIDTSGHYTSLNGTSAGVLLTTDKLYFKKNDDEVRTYDLSKVSDMKVGQDDVRAILEKVQKWAVIVIFPILLIASLIYRLLQVLLYGAVGVLFSKIARVNLSYQSLVRIAVVTLTPVIILSTLFEYFHITYPFELFSYFLLAMVYLYMGVHANKINDNSIMVA